MTVTATELKTNFGKYLDMIYYEDIFITKNGKIIAQLSEPTQDKLSILDSLVGFAKSNNQVDLDEIRNERLSRQ